MKRTSVTHPLRIASIAVGATLGRVGITFCPGKYDENAATGSWDCDLNVDLDAIRDWGAAAVVTLVESDELTLLRVERLGEETVRRGMHWFTCQLQTSRRLTRSSSGDGMLKAPRSAHYCVTDAMLSSTAGVGSDGPARSARGCSSSLGWSQPRLFDRSAPPGRAPSRPPLRSGMCSALDVLPTEGGPGHPTASASSTESSGASLVVPAATRWGRRWSSCLTRASWPVMARRGLPTSTLPMAESGSSPTTPGWPCSPSSVMLLRESPEKSQIDRQPRSLPHSQRESCGVLRGTTPTRAPAAPGFSKRATTAPIR